MPSATLPRVLSLFSYIYLFATPWTIALQAPLCMGFPRQEYWSGLPFSSSGYLPNQGIKPTSPVAPALAGRFFTTEPLAKPIGPLVCHRSCRETDPAVMDCAHLSRVVNSVS